MALLSRSWQLHDVDDVERFCEQIVARSGLELSFHEREDLLSYLIATCWELSLDYDSEGIKHFGIWARRILGLRTIDWIRRYRGRTRWQFAGSAYERPRYRLISLDADECRLDAALPCKRPGPWYT